MSPRVKQYLGTLLYALIEERHCALVVGLRGSNLGLALNRWGRLGDLPSTPHGEVEEFYEDDIVGDGQVAPPTAAKSAGPVKGTTVLSRLTASSVHG
jgi:hypothetical protein